MAHHNTIGRLNKVLCKKIIPNIGTRPHKVELQIFLGIHTNMAAKRNFTHYYVD